MAGAEKSLHLGHVEILAKGILSGAGKMECLSWSELKWKRDLGKLVAGRYYRITDYRCTTVTEDTRSANLDFDIVLLALSSSCLSEEALALGRAGEDYEGTCLEGAKFEAWRLWYCLDNDPLRFAWADEENGRGVIYRMIDEWDNDVPYDFKNIEFKRYRVVADGDFFLESSLNGKFMGFKDYAGQGLKFSEAGEYDWFPTFDGKTQVMSPFSRTMGNKIEKAVLLNDQNGRYIQVLNDIVMMREATYNFFGMNCIHFTFEEGCRRNIFKGSVQSESSYNIFGDYAVGNFFGCSLCENTFDGKFSQNRIDYRCMENLFGYKLKGNRIGSNFSGNQIGAGCEYNVIGNVCGSLEIGTNCVCNEIGDYSSNMLMAECCSTNRIGRGVSNVEIGSGGHNNQIGDGSNHIVFTDGCGDNVIGIDNVEIGLENASANCRIGNENVSIILVECLMCEVGDNCGSVTIQGSKRNRIDSGCVNVTIVGDYNYLKGQCEGILLEEGSSYNSLGSGCKYVSMTSSIDNRIGSSCTGISLGSNAKGCEIGSRCNNICFGKIGNYHLVSRNYHYVSVAAGLKDIAIYNDTLQSQTNDEDLAMCNVNICKGVYGDTNIEIPDKYLNSEGEITVYSNGGKPIVMLNFAC